MVETGEMERSDEIYSSGDFRFAAHLNTESRLGITVRDDQGPRGCCGQRVNFMWFGGNTKSKIRPCVLNSILSLQSSWKVQCKCSLVMLARILRICCMVTVEDSWGPEGREGVDLFTASSLVRVSIRWFSLGVTCFRVFTSSRIRYVCEQNMDLHFSEKHILSVYGSFGTARWLTVGTRPTQTPNFRDGLCVGFLGPPRLIQRGNYGQVGVIPDLNRETRLMKQLSFRSGCIWVKGTDHSWD